jgi:hypothetical protein
LRRYVFLWLLILSFLFLAWAEESESLKIEASVTPKNLLTGREGKIVFKLSVQEGITISAQPFFVIELDPCEELAFSKSSFTESDLKIEILEESGDKSLNLEKPIEIPFLVRLKAKRGSHSLEGKIKYFACAKEQGWCLKGKAKFTASYFIQR